MYETTTYTNLRTSRSCCINRYASAAAKVTDDAPRMDLMGEEALTKIVDKADVKIPAGSLYNITMAGDIAGNTPYYALAVMGKEELYDPWWFIWPKRWYGGCISS